MRRPTVVPGIGVSKALVWGDPELVARAHEADVLVHVYTFRDEPRKLLAEAASGSPTTELKAFYALGVDGVFADHPDTAVNAR